MTRRLLLRVLFIAALAGCLSSQISDPSAGGASGPEFQVSTWSEPWPNPYYHSGPAAAMAESGEFLIVWTITEWGEMVGRAFDPAGAPVGDESGFGPSSVGYMPAAPDVSASDGQFVAVWASSEGAAYYSVVGQRFDLQGAPQGSRFTVDAYQGWYPEVSSSPEGDFIVTWTNFYVRMSGFTADGELSWRHTEQTIGAYQPSPDVVVDELGNFTAIWPHNNGGQNMGIRARRYDGTSEPLSQVFQVNDHPLGTNPAIAALPGAGFVAVWEGQGQNGTLRGILGRIFDAGNQPLTDVFQVNAATTGFFQAPDVSTDARGNIMVTWQTGTIFNHGDIVRARRYDRTGSPLGAEFAVSQQFATGQSVPDISMRSDGEALITWHSTRRNGGASFPSIRARRYCAAPSVGAIADLAVCAGGDATFSTTTFGRQPLTYQWLKGAEQLQDGGRISGANSPTLVISGADTSDADLYTLQVVDACAEAQTAAAAGQLAIETPPGQGSDLTLQTEDDGATLRFTWGAAAGASSYVVRRDAVPDGSFATVVGAAPDPTTALAIPMTSDTEFFLVAGRNAGCGEGPLR